MHVGLPQTIDSGHGEIIQFKECIHEPDGARLVFEGIVQPGCGPIFHVHLCQAEGFEVRQGSMAYQVPGSPVQYLAQGEATVFEQNVPHKFWNAGDTELILNSWAKPAGNLQRYMTILFLSTSKRHSNTPALFDAAYLTIQYKGEFDVLEIPRPVKSLLFPVLYWVGRVFGLYRKYEIDTSRSRAVSSDAKTVESQRGNERNHSAAKAKAANEPQFRQAISVQHRGVT